MAKRGPKGPDVCPEAYAHLVRVRELRAEGNTYQDIADIFGFSRQAIHDYLKRWAHLS